MGILYSPPAQTITVSGGSGPLSTSTFQNFWLALVTGTPSGTTPTLVMHLDGIDWYGNVINDIVALPAGFSLTTSAASAHCTFGISGPSGLIEAVPALIQIRWVVTGTNPSYPNVQITLNGR